MFIWIQELSLEWEGAKRLSPPFYIHSNKGEAATRAAPPPLTLVAMLLDLIEVFRDWTCTCTYFCMNRISAETRSDNISLDYVFLNFFAKIIIVCFSE